MLVLHAVVIPLYGELPDDLIAYLEQLRSNSLILILVDNRDPMASPQYLAGIPLVGNHNRGGLAGGLNRGVDIAREHGAEVITLLDQDSRLSGDHLHLLKNFLLDQVGSGDTTCLVGPCIWDADRLRLHSPRRRLFSKQAWSATRLLITSGTTFRSGDWPQLGGFDTWMQIDYIDHDWCLRAASRGFRILQLHACHLHQHFGTPHSNWLCRRLGMQLYSPYRHFTALRNLRLFLLRPYVPLIIKLLEVLKMLVKPCAWLLFEPQRKANFQAIHRALLVPLPRQH